MQVGSRGSSLLRSQTSLLVFLAPCVSSTASAAASAPCRTYLAVASIAKPHWSIGAQGGSRQASTAATATQPSSSEDDKPKPEPQPLLRSSPRTAAEIGSRQTSFLNRIRNTPRKTIPRSEEDRARQIDSLLGKSVGSSRDDSGQSSTGDGNSVDYLERRMAEGRRKEFAIAQESTNRQGQISRGMLMPMGWRATTGQRSMAIELPEPTRAAATIKSRPSLGRTVQVMPERGLDLAKALTSLEINCNVNNVKADARAQKYYERPGAKRKRLKSVRWRKRFKIGFNAVVGKVKAMRRKGW
ncbi:MAG: hypothetical protein Q9196_004384 [Gyalolechia fulgens]